MKRWTLGIALALTLGCTGSLEGDGLSLGGSFTTDDFDVQSQELIGGTVTLDRPEIARLYLGGASCTATLVSDRTLVTAKHCVDYTSCNQSGCGDAYNAVVQFETSSGARQYFDVDRFVSFDRNGAVVGNGVSSNIQYTDTRRNDYYLNDDVALVLLKDAVPASVATPTIVPASSPTTGDALTVWGYGCTVRGGGTDGNKRYKDFSVGSSADALCPGDSGGPVTTGRQGVVTYVNSAYIQYQSGASIDIYGDVTRILPEVEAQLAAWGETLGGTPSAPAPAPTPPPAPVRQPLVFAASSQFAIPDRSALALTLSVADARDVQGIQLDFDISHPRPTDLAFVLRAPNNDGVLLQGSGSDSSLSRSFNVDAFDGRSAQGGWTIEVYDVYRGQIGSLTGIEITFF